MPRTEMAGSDTAAKKLWALPCDPVTAPSPFRVAVPDGVLDDLAARLARTRRPPGQRVTDSDPGEQPDEADETLDRIAQLVEYWRDSYDWRAQERRINAVPQYRTTVDGVGLHFLH